jgi:aconitate hydratase
MAIGEGGGELAKQLLGKTYDVKYPEIIGVMLRNAPKDYIGPMDVALAIIKAVFASGFVNNKVMEFVGDGISSLSAEFRNGVDVMTTETTCLSSIWRTDDIIKDYFKTHGREDAYRELNPGEVAYYDGFIEVDLSAIEPMVALPFHPSNAYTIDELYENLDEIENKSEFPLRDKIIGGKIFCGQGSIVGCAGGTFESIAAAADILNGKSCGDGAFSLSVYPGSQPSFMALMEAGVIQRLTPSGAIIRTAFCGPCFGAGDVPANNTLSLRHATRNFPNREGSKPNAGQSAAVALADAKTIAATALNKGLLTSAKDINVAYTTPAYSFNKEIYENRVYNGYKNPDADAELVLGPNIKDWPTFAPLTNDVLLKVVSLITDPVTTTDELIPSGETSSYRSNPEGLSEFTLSRKDPDYVPRAKAVREAERARQDGRDPALALSELKIIYDTIGKRFNIDAAKTAVGSVICSVKPGDGSAREQAASCQKVLGGLANICREYATKRYRSNLINWGMLPFTADETLFKNGEYIYVPNVIEFIKSGVPEVDAYIVKENGLMDIKLRISELTPDERRILIDGCLINHYKR